MHKDCSTTGICLRLNWALNLSKDRQIYSWSWIPKVLQQLWGIFCSFNYSYFKSWASKHEFLEQGLIKDHKTWNSTPPVRWLPRSEEMERVWPWWPCCDQGIILPICMWWWCLSHDCKTTYQSPHPWATLNYHPVWLEDQCPRLHWLRQTICDKRIIGDQAPKTTTHIILTPSVLVFPFLKWGSLNSFISF